MAPNRAKALPSAIGVEADPLGAFCTTATIVRAKRGQRFSLSAGQRRSVYVVRKGLLVLQAKISGKRRQLLNLFYPKDIVRSSCVPPLPEASLVAAVVSEIWRVPTSSFEALANSDASLRRSLSQQLAHQHSRANLHIAAIGNLTSEERLASFLIEMALRIGVAGPDGIAFQIPLSRIDIADYLAINADTLSRVMSRFRARGIVFQTRRGRTLLPDGRTLRDLSPIADAVVALHGSAASKRDPCFSMLT